MNTRQDLDEYLQKSISRCNNKILAQPEEADYWLGRKFAYQELMNML